MEKSGIRLKKFPAAGLSSFAARFTKFSDKKSYVVRCVAAPDSPKEKFGIFLHLFARGKSAYNCSINFFFPLIGIFL